MCKGDVDCALQWVGKLVELIRVVRQSYFPDAKIEDTRNTNASIYDRQEEYQATPLQRHKPSPRQRPSFIPVLVQRTSGSDVYKRSHILPRE